MKAKVLAIPEVIDYLYELVDILYEKHYFGYKYNSVEYVIEQFEDIITNLPKKQHRPAPRYYDKYEKGMFYALFRKNKHTQYYAFFTKYNNNGETIYLVRYIGNNHTEAQHLDTY